MAIETEPLASSETEERDQGQYLDPETLKPEDLERVLKEGQVINIRPIEIGPQTVPPHADRVLLGDIDQYAPKHKDIVEMAEIEIPEKGQKILVVYKPDSGVNQGPMQGEPLALPENSSPYSHKEVAAWKITSVLGITSLPVVLREDLPEGKGSLRPYIWGEPLELLSSTLKDKALGQRKDVENIAVFDYLLQTLDRRESNLLWTNKENLVPIDNSLTFFDEVFALQFHVKGPRWNMAFDTESKVIRLKHRPLPERITSNLQRFLDQEQDCREELSGILTEEEISGIFERTRAVLEAGTFL